MKNGPKTLVRILAFVAACAIPAILPAQDTQDIDVQQGSKLVGTGALGPALQGSSVALSADGNTALVGGYQDNGQGQDFGDGAVWVWTRSGATWTQQAKLADPALAGSLSEQGWSVALSADGNTALTGCPTNLGKTLVWVRSGASWSLQATLSGSGLTGPYGFQGIAVALSADGNTALVGGVMDGGGSLTGYGIGAAWVYTRTGAVWAQQGPKLVGSGAVGASDQGLSVALSADGNTAMVGGDLDNHIKGAVWVWTRSGGVWTQQGPKLTGLPASFTGGFGTAVGLSADGNTAIVGAHDSHGEVGALYPFTRSGGVWTQQGPELVGADFSGICDQGISAALSADGNTAIVGGVRDAGGAGAAWIFTRNGGVWSQQGTKIVGTGAVGNAEQGWRVAISGDGKTAIVGGLEDNTQVGAAWVNVATAPIITTAPANAGACAGLPVSFTAVGASWLPQTVQWQVSTNGGGSFSDVPGATSPTLTLTATAGLDGNQYRAVFTSALGTTPTSAGTLTVATAPVVTTQPTNQSVNAGQTATFTAAATGSPTPTVAWWVSTDGGFTAAPVPGATSTTLSFPAATGQSGNLYFAVFTTACASVQSNAASLTVMSPPVPPVVTTQPASLVVCPGQAGALSQFLQQGSKLTPTGSAGNPLLGYSAALSADGTTAIVGGAEDNNGVGAGWVFTRSGDSWTQQGGKLVGSGPGTQQGFSVALSANGNTALTGAWGTGGGAWVWTRSGGVWTQQGPVLTPTGSSPTSEFGYSVALSADGNIAAVGGPDDNSVQGAIWVFTRSGTTWTQQGPKLVGSGVVGFAAQGISVALSGDGNTLLEGGLFDNSQAGAAWVFTRSGTAWTQQGPKLVGAVASASAQQGIRVGLSTDGNTALVGTFDDVPTGGAFVFTRSGTLWTQQGPKLVPTGSVGFGDAGSAVALSGDGNTAVLGGWFEAGKIGGSWIFTRTLGVWTQQGSKLVGSGSQFYSIFPPEQGYSVGISADGSTMISGGIGDFPSGAAWVFAKNQASFTAAADGAPVPTVQWQVSTDGGANFNDIAGATNFGLAVTASPDTSGFQYRAVFTNSGGTATSNAATFTVYAPPVVTADPADQAQLPGHTATFSAAADGSPAPSVRWQQSTHGIASFTDIPGETSPTLAFTVAPEMNGNRYRAIFTNACGTAATGSAVLTSVTNLSADPMAVDAHAVAGDSSNHNGVLEPGETVQVAPAWTNNVASTQAATATASNLNGPAGPTYTLNDTSAGYGSVAAGATNDCFTATGNCYLMTVAGARPVQHWDAYFTEGLSVAGILKGWRLHVGASFPDVPTSQQFYKFIENLFHNGITGGCAAGNFCPTGSTTRGQMAVFLLKSKHGSDYLPPACAGVFSDVACPSQFADWIEQLFHESITGGCGPGSYCPNNPVRRDQMAAFLLKAEHGSGYAPPACAGIFPDVPCPSQFAAWIEQLFHESITGGCGSGNYCPSSPNTRGQMAVFLVKTFGLELYGP